MHSLAESARWSNWPGRNSTPKTVAFASSGELGVDGVGLRLAEHRGGAGREELFGDAFHIVAIEQAQVLQSLDAEDRAQFVQQLLRFDIESGLLFNIDT